jgi:hypothetical protein
MSPLWLLLIGWCVGYTALWGQSIPQNQFILGVESYTGQNYVEAAAIFEDLAQTHPSPAVFYNLGNTLYRLGKKGEAVAAYHAALHLDPGHEDALFNLQFMGGYSAADLFYYRWTGGLSQKSWAFATLLFLCLISVGVVILYRRPTLGLARVIMAGMGLSLLAALVCFGATLLRSHWQNQTLGVVIVPAVELKAEPVVLSQTLVRAQEGASGQIIGESGEWYYLRIDGMEPGWVPKSTLRNTATWK